MLFTFLLCALIGYMIGSVPFGLLLTKWTGRGDIRTVGSGNIGATNVLRTGSKTLAALTLALDMGKGIVSIILSIFLIQFLMPFANGQNPDCDPATHIPNIYYDPCGYSAGQMEYVLFLAGAATVIGHMFPIWLKYKGGKGVATFFGMMIGFSASVGGLALATWLAIAIISKRSSLAALISVALTPVYMILYSIDDIVRLAYGTGDTYSLESMFPILGTIILGALVFYQHRENIKRLLAGTEPKISIPT